MITDKALESPIDYEYINLLDEEQIFMFPQNFDQMEIQDELTIDNNIYFLNNLPSKDLSKRNITIPNKSQEKKGNDNDILILDDFESFYENAYADIKNDNVINSDKEENKNPSFTMNLDYECKLVYSLIEDEKQIIFENRELILKKKLEKEKIFEISKEKKVEKNIAKNKQSIKPKANNRKKKDKNNININDKCFPFNSGGSVFLNSNQTNEDLLFFTNENSNNDYPHSQDTFLTYIEKGKENGNYLEEKKEIEEKSNNDIQIQIINDNFNFKFKTKKYFVAPDGKKKKVKKIRKFKSDDIRKKIKSRFHKTLKNIINENLKKAGAKELFDFLPQCFIGNVVKKTNSKYLKLTYKELLSTNFASQLKNEDYNNYQVEQNKYKKNIEVLKYLEMNPDICKKSGFDLIKNMKYEEIINNYFSSKQFENSLIQLKEEKETPEYIMEYIKIAKSYVSFYSNEKEDNDNIEINEKIFEENEDEEDEEIFQDYNFF